MLATGGVVTTDGLYTVHKFTRGPRGSAIANSEFPGGFLAAYAFDQTVGTRWSAAAAAPAWCGFFFDTATAVQEVALTSFGSTGYTPKSFNVEYSDDGVTWTLAWNVSGQAGWPASTKRTFNNAGAFGTHRYWRIYWNDTDTPGANPSIDAIEFHATIGGSDMTQSPTASLVVTQAGNAEVLIVAGGSGGANGLSRSGGGGGGGDAYHDAAMAFTVGTKPVVVGAGGVSDTAGGDSSLNGITAKGGGKGGASGGNGFSGGSGGGARHGASFTGGAVISGGIGHVGGNGGYDSGSGVGVFTGSGGGGMGSAGVAGTNLVAGSGGDGVQYSIDGTARYYGGGGGGSSGNYGGQSTPLGGAAGLGGGAGASGLGVSTPGGNAPKDVGGGGGAGGHDGAGGTGSDGVVVVRYLTPLSDRSMNATLPLPLGVSGTIQTLVPSGITAILPLGLRAAGVIAHAVDIAASMRLPLRLATGLIEAINRITGSMRLPLGVSGSFTHNLTPCSLLLEVFNPISIFGVGAHRYWRLSCTATIGGGPPAIAALRIGSETEWFDPSDADVTASSVNNGYVVANLFDGNLATIWVPNTQVCWLQFDFGSSPVAAHRLGITPRDDVFSAAAQSMKDFALQWSDDGVTWTNDWSVATQVDWTESVEKIYARSVYGDPIGDDIAWSVSSNPSDELPYLIGPKQYAAQEIDPIACTASIGQVEVGVIDVPTVDGDQSTGWMTGRINDILGRRCRLKRYVNGAVGWITIADGPAGAPKMDPSYSAYRWTIRDTRDMERRLSVFKRGGYATLVPAGGIVNGFGQYTDDTGDHLLVEPATPMLGHYNIADALEGGITKKVGSVSFGDHFTGLSSFVVDTEDLVVSDLGASMAEAVQIGANRWASPLIDVLWRLPGDTAWNIARVASSSFYRLASANVTNAQLTDTDGEWVKAISSVYLFFDDAIPAGFPGAACDMEIIVRSRAAASDEFPIYVEDALGDVLTNLYDGVLSLAPTYGGLLYDPAELNASTDVGPQIQYDPVAFTDLTEQVRLRQTSPVDDARSWAESALYGPSGWIATMDKDLRISPRSRNSPSTVTGTVIRDAISVPAPNWNLGSVMVSEIEYTYPRYFIPTEPEPNVSSYATTPDGLAKRNVTITFDDEEADFRYGVQRQAYDASAFAAIGTPDGVNLPGQLEQASAFAQTARYEVLQRYRAGVPAIALQVRRSEIPLLCAGDWTPYDISWIPGALNLRGASGAAQVISIRDDNCTWRTVSLDLVPALSEAPGYADSLIKLTDVIDPGYSDGLSLLDDVDEGE